MLIAFPPSAAVYLFLYEDSHVHLIFASGLLFQTPESARTNCTCPGPTLQLRCAGTSGNHKVDAFRPVPCRAQGRRAFGAAYLSHG